MASKDLSLAAAEAAVRSCTVCQSSSVILFRLCTGTGGNFFHFHCVCAGCIETIYKQKYHYVKAFITSDDSLEITVNNPYDVGRELSCPVCRKTINTPVIMDQLGHTVFHKISFHGLSKFMDPEDRCSVFGQKTEDAMEQWSTLENSISDFIGHIKSLKGTYIMYPEQKEKIKKLGKEEISLRNKLKNLEDYIKITESTLSNTEQILYRRQEDIQTALREIDELERNKKKLQGDLERQMTKLENELSNIHASIEKAKKKEKNLLEELEKKIKKECETEWKNRLAKKIRELDTKIEALGDREVVEKYLQEVQKLPVSYARAAGAVPKKMPKKMSKKEMTNTESRFWSAFGEYLKIPTECRSRSIFECIKFLEENPNKTYMDFLIKTVSF